MARGQGNAGQFSRWGPSHRPRGPQGRETAYRRPSGSAGTAWNAGLRPASRGSAKPASTTLRHAKVGAGPCMTGGVCRRARSWGFLPVGPGIAGQGQRNPRYAVLPYGAGAGAPTRRAVPAQQFDEGDDQRCLGQLRSEHSFGHPRSTLARSALVAKSAKSGFVRWWLRTPWTVPAVGRIGRRRVASAFSS